MPIGILINNLAVAVGGLLGGVLGPRLTPRVTKALNDVMGFVALGIAISLVVKVNALAAVVLSVLLGTLVGTLLKLDDRISSFFLKLNTRIFKDVEGGDEYISRFTTLLLLCCASGTGVFGSINEGLTGDSSIILCKAILDFTCVMIFASSIGKSCSIIAIPQMIIFLTLFFTAQQLSPLMTDALKGDFSAAGGVIELVIGFKILGLTKFKALDLLPALILVFPISYFWGMLF